MSMNSAVTSPMFIYQPSKQQISKGFDIVALSLCMSVVAELIRYSLTEKQDSHTSILPYWWNYQRQNSQHNLGIVNLLPQEMLALKKGKKMKKTITPDPDEHVFYGNQIDANSIEKINEHLKKLFKQDNWEEALKNFVRNNLRGSAMRIYGLALSLAYADKRIKADGKEKQGLLPILIRELGTSRTEGYGLKRAGEIILTLMEDPGLWKVFVKRHLPNTTIYKLYTLKEACSQYRKSKRTNSDRKTLLTEIGFIHNMTRDQLRQMQNDPDEDEDPGLDPCMAKAS